MSDDKNVRHRFTVPVADTKVNQWIESQSNLGFSLRVLIKAYVRNYGYQDATCLEFGSEVKKRGRPSKQMKIQLGQMLDDTDENEYQGDTDVADDFPPVEVNAEPVRPAPVTQSSPAAPAKPAVPVKTVEKPVEPVHTVAEDIKPADDPMSMFGVADNTPVENQTSESMSSASSDDDGFVDPEDLFR